jgi:hypothetical protein
MFGDVEQGTSTFAHQMGMKNRGSLQILWVSMAKFNRSMNIFPRKIKNMRKKYAQRSRNYAQNLHILGKWQICAKYVHICALHNPPLRQAL